MKYITFTRYVEIPIRCRVPIIGPTSNSEWFIPMTDEPELSWEFNQEIPPELINSILENEGLSISEEALEFFRNKEEEC